MELTRDPIEYSRRLVLVVLLPVLVIDLVVGLPGGVFLAVVGAVFVAAAAIHAIGEEYRATAGWLCFGVALVVLAAVDVVASPLYTATFAVLLVAGLLFLASERLTGSD